MYRFSIWDNFDSQISGNEAVMGTYDILTLKFPQQCVFDFFFDIRKFVTVRYNLNNDYNLLS